MAYIHSGVNCFWIIDNSKEVLDRLQNINKNSRATSFDSYDFATLYTNKPHDALKNNIRVLVHEALKIRELSISWSIDMKCTLVSSNIIDGCMY